jgi:hypothetical protein
MIAFVGNLAVAELASNSVNPLEARMANNTQKGDAAAPAW